MLPQLDPDECRVVGVMIEKAHTTPAQYPMTLNAITAGCSQKSNRHPVVNFDEMQVQDTLDRLRAKGLAVMVDMAGSRVLKYKHDLRQTLGLSTSERVVMAELLLRGPQTLGELRTRASRMHPLESLEVVQNVLQHLMDRDEPFVKRLAPTPGSRAERYAQLLCPDLHPVELLGVEAAATGTTRTDQTALADRVQRLELEVAQLRQVVRRVAVSLGEPQLADDPAENGIE